MADGRLSALIHVAGAFRGTRQVAHEFVGQGRRETCNINGLGHAFQPEIPHLRADRNVLVDFFQPGMTMVLEIVGRPAEEARQIVELFDPGVGHAVPPEMKQVQVAGVFLGFDDVIEGLDQRTDTLVLADPLVERCLRVRSRLHRACAPCFNEDVIASECRP
jgi:hypothetical protein